MANDLGQLVPCAGTTWDSVSGIWSPTDLVFCLPSFVSLSCDIGPKFLCKPVRVKENPKWGGRK